MSNDSNLFINSQLPNSSSEQKKIRDTLYRCSEPELLIIQFAKTIERGIDTADVMKYLQCSDSAASSTLRRLADSEYNKRLIFPLFNRSKCGARGAWLYFLKTEVKLEDVQAIIKDRGYGYEDFIERQSKKNSRQNQESESNSTKVSSDSTLINDLKKENVQEQKVESSVCESVDTINQDSDLPDLPESNDSEFGYIFKILRNEIAEKHKELEQLKKEYYKAVASLSKLKAG
ncbi:hypothetical protein [Nostoc sp. CCY 9925]|uniref:hypothetical protein n=1 Tax=Nostoc sp. CCY 9925 TaxID=3103865 RepID=UPI0039C65FC6